MRKSTRNIYKSPFSIAFCMFTRGYIHVTSRLSRMAISQWQHPRSLTSEDPKARTTSVWRSVCRRSPPMPGPKWTEPTKKWPSRDAIGVSENGDTPAANRFNPEMAIYYLDVNLILKKVPYGHFVQTNCHIATPQNVLVCKSIHDIMTSLQRVAGFNPLKNMLDLGG